MQTLTFLTCSRSHVGRRVTNEIRDGRSTVERPLSFVVCTVQCHRIPSRLTRERLEGGETRTTDKVDDGWWVCRDRLGCPD